MLEQSAKEAGSRGLLGRATRLLRLLLVVSVAAVLLGFAGTRYLTHRAEQAYPPLGEVVVVDGLRQHVYQEGNGPPVVFVHGAFGGLQDFTSTILPKAAESYRVVAWDRPGHGYSERPETIADPGVQADILLALIDALGLERPQLVGFSFGGAVVLAAAVRAPERLRGVLLLNGPSHTWPDPLDFSYVFPSYPIVGPLLTETWTAPFGHLLASGSIRQAFDPQPVSESFRASPLSLALRPANYRANAEDVRTLKPFLRSQASAYPELAVPVTMVVSEGDRVVSPTIHSLQLVEAQPAVNVIRIPDGGHQLLYTHPERVLEILDGAMGR